MSAAGQPQGTRPLGGTARSDAQGDTGAASQAQGTHSPGATARSGTLGEDPSLAQGAWFDDVRIGDRFSARVTITDAHLLIGAGLIGDFNPHHVDDEYARTTRFGSRILHGVLTSALMGAPVGMHFHGTAVAYLEHAARFVAPARPGDTLTTTWTVAACDPKPVKRSGVVVLTGVCHKQGGVLVAEASAKMLVNMRPAPAAAT